MIAIHTKHVMLQIICDLDSAVATLVSTMFMYGIVIIQVLVNLTYGNPVASQEQPVNCSSYLDIIYHEWNCRDRDDEGSLFNLLNRLLDRSWTGDDLRAGLQTACSLTLPSSLTEYRQCTMRLAVVCPSLPIADAITNKVKTYCSHGSVSPLLNKALSVPINYDPSCFGDMQETFNTSCLRSLRAVMDSLYRHGNLSTMAAYSVNHMTGFHGCVKDALKAIDTTQCESTWQELTFGLILSVTGVVGLGINLPEVVLNAMTNDLIRMNNSNNVGDTMFW